jgi:AbrB family looped-hinge helix DNA binding protein
LVSLRDAESGCKCVGQLGIAGVMRYLEKMTKVHSRMTVQGQISVPAEVRRKLGLAPGSVLEWHEEGGQYIVRRASRYSSKDIHDAVFHTKPDTKALAELKEGIRRRTRRKHARD